MPHIRRTWPLALASALALGAQASDNPHAHRHGYATLRVVIDGPRLLTILQAPAHSLLGFEHLPADPSEQHSLDQALSWLATTPQLSASGANCRVTGLSIDNPFEPAHTRAGDTHESSHDADHQHHEHAPQHEENGHRDFEISQEILCDQPLHNQPLQSALPEHFGPLEQLRVEWVTGDDAGVAQLTSGNDRFTPSSR